MKNLFYIFIFIPFLALAQNKNFEKGLKHFEKEEYAASLQKFNKAGDPGSDLNLTYYLARNYHLLNKPDTALHFYNLLDKANTKNREYLIHYAGLLMERASYDQAKKAIKKLLSYEPGNTKAELYYKSCMASENLMANPNFLVFESSAVNSNFDDFSPAFINENTMLFCSNRTDENNSNDFSRDDTRFINIYSSNKSMATGFDKVSAVTDLNSKYHEGPMAYESNTNSLYFTKSVKTQHADLGYSYTLAIFKSEYKNGIWSKPEAFAHNTEGYSVGHPALTADGKKLYFVSDKPGGIGKTDIYVCLLENGKWSQPKNLGAEVNTAEEELFPTVLNSGDLAFSSKGRVGLGGLDIYKLDKNGLIENLGYPINSSKDDFGLTTTDVEGKRGYFSSNRKNQYTGDNIYLYKPISILVSGYLKDSISGKSVPNGQWRLVDTDGKIIDFELDKDGFYASSLKPEEDYQFQFTAPNYNMRKLPFSTRNLNKDLDTNLNILLSRGQTPILEGVVVDQVDTLPISGAKVKLTEVEKGKTEQLETDTTGYYIFFVDSTKKYELNIDHPKFLVSMLPINKIESNYIGYKKSAYNIKMVSIKAIELNKPLEIENIYYDYDKYNITPTSAAILDTLQKLMVDNDDIIVELSSHTDVRGSDEYNLILSKERAQAAINYLVAKGIDEYRLVFKFYGKTELAIPCPKNADCPESIHKLNRRTEFRIIGY